MQVSVGARRNQDCLHPKPALGASVVTYCLRISAFAIVGATFGCQLIDRVERSTDAIDENRAAVEKSTASINANAAAIDASSVRIYDNARSVQAASQAIEANTIAVRRSAMEIDSISGVAAESARVIADNKVSVERNTAAVAENEAIVRKTTTAINELRQLLSISDVLSRQKLWITVIALLVSLLLITPSVLLWVALRRIERILKVSQPR